jgi:hypothetical protein
VDFRRCRQGDKTDVEETRLCISILSLVSMTKRVELTPCIGYCIYCLSVSKLSAEHVLPFGLGGKFVLKDASCAACAKITGALEQRLLRGQWWPYRKKLGIQTRSKEYPAYRPVKLKHAFGDSVEAMVRSDDYPIVMFLTFDPPAALSGETRTDYPFATRMVAKTIAPMPTHLLIDGQMRRLAQGDQIEFPVHFDAGDLARFLAKVAHGFAIFSKGELACSEYFLPSFILGTGHGALTYVGGASSLLVQSLLPPSGVNALVTRVQGNYLSVYVQLFRDAGEPPPVYEVLVGRL